MPNLYTLKARECKPTFVYHAQGGRHDPGNVCKRMLAIKCKTRPRGVGEENKRKEEREKVEREIEGPWEAQG